MYISRFIDIRFSVLPFFEPTILEFISFQFPFMHVYRRIVDRYYIFINFDRNGQSGIKLKPADSSLYKGPTRPYFYAGSLYRRVRFHRR